MKFWCIVKSFPLVGKLFFISFLLLVFKPYESRDEEIPCMEKAGISIPLAEHVSFNHLNSLRPPRDTTGFFQIEIINL